MVAKMYSYRGIKLPFVQQRTKEVVWRRKNVGEFLLGHPMAADGWGGSPSNHHNTLQ